MTFLILSYSPPVSTLPAIRSGLLRTAIEFATWHSYLTTTVSDCYRLITRANILDVITGTKPLLENVQEPQLMEVKFAIPGIDMGQAAIAESPSPIRSAHMGFLAESRCIDA
jgi:hypothetical protein